MKTVINLATLALVVPTLAAADPLPKPVQNLDCLVGAWKGTGTVAMGKDKAKVDVQIDCKRTSARFAVQCSTRFTGIPGVAVYEESDLFGYEPNTDTYHWYAITNAGETHDHVMKNPGDTTKLQWVFNGTQEGKAFKEVIDMDIAKDDRSFTFRSESFVAGASMAVLDAKVHK